MELHLHLSVAFRALDRKWGTPVDLDTPEDLSRCLPAVVDMPTATFSSEEFLRSKRRQKPYSRREHRTKEQVEVNDSFSNISCSRIPSVSDLEEIISSRGSCLSIKTEFSTDLDRSIMEYLGDCDKKYEVGSTVTLDSGFGRGEERNVFRRMRVAAKSIVTRNNLR